MTALPKFGLGAPQRRLEDAAFLTGAGRYTDDIEADGALRAHVVRSEVGHAYFAIAGIDAARAAAGVQLVWTAADLPALGGLPATSLPDNSDGSPVEAPPRPILAAGKARHVGEPIALVVAETIEAARDAAALLQIDYDPLPAAIDLRAALADGADLVWPERGSNLAFDAAIGDAEATEAAFAGAARVCRVEVVNNRVVANYMETRGVLAEFDPETGRYTITLGTQGGHSIRDVLAEYILGLPAETIRVVTPDVGGGFGPKAFVYAEYPLAMLAARATGRPVKWVGERTEHFLGDAHGRDNLTSAEMALDGDGRFLAVRVDLLSNVGAYLSEYGGSVAVDGASMTPGPYAIPTVSVRVRGVFTNTVPTDAYRGAGRPEAAYLLERLVDACGRETGLGPVEIRRRNLIGRERMPYVTATGRTYDSGDFAGTLEAALAAADHAGFARRAEASLRAGRLRGIGIGCYIEACAFPGREPATLRLDDDGGATLLIGTQSSGQGHATAYAQVASAPLGLDAGAIRTIQGDTDQVAEGGGTLGSRSVPIGAASVERAAAALATRIKVLAASMLGARADELELGDGLVRVAGSNRSLALAEVAAANPVGERTVTAGYRQRAPTFPNGTHICEIEVDPETGECVIVGYTIVDDFGTTVNPLLLAGQVIGGVAQGLGQALLERTTYDADGQLLTGSFLDYPIPRAADVPAIALKTRNIACTTNPLGIKGAGEAGAIGACGAIMNALDDALRRAGAKAPDMPATPFRVWAALRGAPA